MKKLIASIALVLVMLLSQTVIAEEQTNSGEAVIKNKDAVYTINGDVTEILGDEKIATQHKATEKFVVKITSQSEFSYINVLFDKVPPTYTLEYADVKSKQGTHEFIHDLIKLDAPQKEIVLTFENGAVLGSVDLYSAGKLPPKIQQWQPPYDDADMLVLPTHADDEQLYFGGAVARYAGTEKKKVQIAYLVNHFGEPYRQHELLNGLWEIGITAYPVIPKEFTDIMADSLEKARTLYDTQVMLEYQVSLIRRFKPEVVIGHDLNGEYGHGVHMLNANLLTQAVELSSVATIFPTSYKEYGAFDVPKTYLHLYDQNKIEIDVDTPLEAFGERTAFQVAEDGFALHKSQQTGAFAVEKDGKYDCRKFGLFRTTVGNDLMGIDMFENVGNSVTGAVTPPSSALSSSDSGSSSAIDGAGVTSSDVDTTSSEAQVAPPEKEPSFWENMRSYIYIIAGAAVIIFTMLTHNKRVARKIDSHTLAYKQAPRNR